MASPASPGIRYCPVFMGFHPIEGSVVAVTGGGGFVGRRLVERLAAERPAKIVVLDRRPLDFSELAPRIETREISLGGAPLEAVRDALASVTHLVHLAAEKHSDAHARPEEILVTNVLGTHSLFRAARDASVKRVVFASSLYAYGRMRGGPLTESETPAPVTVYGISKLAGEHLGAHFAAGGGPAFVALRYFFAYGPRQTPLHGRPSFIIRNLERLARAEAPIVRGNGAQVLDYVYVDDVVTATIRAMTSDVTGETLNVGSGMSLSVRDLVERMQRVAGTSFAPIEEPADATQGTSRVASTEKALDLLGWTPNVGIDEGLARTWEWIRAAGPLRP
jgi:nucleoside-diphosphate-sugar epimerase